MTLGHFSRPSASIAVHVNHWRSRSNADFYLVGLRWDQRFSISPKLPVCVTKHKDTHLSSKSWAKSASSELDEMKVREVWIFKGKLRTVIRSKILKDEIKKSIHFFYHPPPTLFCMLSIQRRDLLVSKASVLC